MTDWIFFYSEAGPVEHSNEVSNSICVREFFDQLSDYRLLEDRLLHGVRISISWTDILPNLQAGVVISALSETGNTKTSLPLKKLQIYKPTSNHERIRTTFIPLMHKKFENISSLYLSNN